jgi:DNA helicase IV
MITMPGIKFLVYNVPLCRYIAQACRETGIDNLNNNAKQVNSGLRFPRWEALNRDEQVPILNLPLDRDYLVTGGPGTGKTVLAIYRAARLRGKYKITASVDTYHHWLYTQYGQWFKTKVPELSPFVPDWDIVVPRMIEKLQNEGPLFDHLILDEAQDFPLPLLKILKHTCNNVTVFMDPPQALFKTKQETTTMVPDMLNIFQINTGRYYLTRNYRNTEEIYTFARLFYTGDPDMLPAHPPRKSELPQFVHTPSFEDAIDRIIIYATNYPEQNIGIFLTDYNLREKYFAALVDKGIPNVQQYRSGNRANNENIFNFSSNGLKIMTFNTMKGLEFDVVFIPELHDTFFSSETLENGNPF